MISLPTRVEANADDKTIIMFIPDTDWPPYLINDPRYPGGGVLLEVMRAVVTPLGYEVKTCRLPNKRGWELLNCREVDAHAKAKEWVKYPDNYQWTAPFMLHEGVLLYRSNNNLEYTKPEALYGKTLVGIKGFIYPTLEPHFGPGKIHRIDVSNPFAMLELLNLGRVDAAMVNKNETLWLFKNRPDLNPERFRLDSKPFGSAGYRYVFNNDKRWAPFIEKFNARLDEMKRNGDLDKILDQYR